MSEILEKWELPLLHHVRQIRCVHIIWVWNPGICHLQAEGSRWVWKISAFPGEDSWKRCAYWMVRVIRQARFRSTMEWDSEVATEWLERLPVECAKEFVAKWQSTFVRSGWLPGTARAFSEGDEQNWVLMNSAKGDDLVISTGQALWAGAFQRTYWLVMTCQKEHAVRLGFLSVLLGVIQKTMAFLVLCCCSMIAYNSLWVHSLPGFSWAKNHGHAAVKHQQNQQNQWRLAILGFVAESQRRCSEGLLPAHCHLMDQSLFSLRTQFCGKVAPNPDSLELAIGNLSTYARWSSSAWYQQVPEVANTRFLMDKDLSTSNCLPMASPERPHFHLDSSVASWPDWTSDVLRIIPDDLIKLEWIRGSYEARLSLLRQCVETCDVDSVETIGKKCEQLRHRLWLVAPINWLQKLGLPGPVIQNWGRWENDSVSFDSLSGEERTLFSLLVERPRCAVLQKQMEKRLVAWRAQYARIRAGWMAGPAKSFPFLVTTNEEIDGGSWTYWFGAESPINELQKAYDTLSAQGLRLSAWEKLSVRIDSLRGSSPFAPLADLQWQYRFCGGAHLPVSLAVGGELVELRGGMPCKEGEFSFVETSKHPLIWGKPPLNLDVLSSPWHILRFVAMGTPKPGGGVRCMLRIDGGGFHEFASLELHAKQGNSRWLNLGNWQLNWPGLDALPISYPNERSACHGQESQFPKRNTSSTSEYTPERGGRLGATEARVAAQITGTGALRSH